MGGYMVTTLKALADENRLRIINLLNKQELCVCEIETMLDLTQTNVSRHLAKLKGAKLITPFKDAQWVHYRLSAQFRKDKFLLSYLIMKFGEEEPFVSDIARLKRYNENGLNCTYIREDKENVLNIIRGENE